MDGQQNTENFSDKIGNVNPDDKFAAIFDQLISNNFITEDITIDGVKFTLKTLSSREYLDSDSIYLATLPGLPVDIVGRARMISNLAYSIIAINDIPVIESEQNKRAERQALFEKLYKLPPWIIDELNKVFVKIMRMQQDTVVELNNIPGKAAEQMENF